MADHAIAKILRVFLLQAETVIFLVLIPLLQLNNNVNVLRIANTGNTEQSLYIDDSDSPELDKVLGDIRCRAHQGFLGNLADFHNIIADKAVSSFDQLQRCL